MCWLPISAAGASAPERYTLLEQILRSRGLPLENEESAWEQTAHRSSLLPPEMPIGHRFRPLVLVPEDLDALIGICRARGNKDRVMQ